MQIIFSKYVQGIFQVYFCIKEEKQINSPLHESGAQKHVPLDELKKNLSIFFYFQTAAAPAF